MPLPRTLILAALLLLSLGAIAQGTEQRIDSADMKEFLWKQRHSPTRAAIYSAVIPGLGQAYNRKYWKIPIAWGGLYLSYWFVRENNTEYQRYKDAYLAVIDNDPNTVDEFNGEYSASSLLDVSDTYRRWRDLSWIAFGAVYMLNVMDAAVDAHFVRFDISRDLTLNLGPSLDLAATGTFGIGLSARF